MDENFEDHPRDPETWLRLVAEEAKKIDPRTMRAIWKYAHTLDPCGIYTLPPDMQCVGREYFVSRPGSNIWVWEGDLPEETRKEIPRAIKAF